MRHDLEDRIRLRAHRLWEDEGRPEGRADVHWEKARILVAIEDDRTSLIPVSDASTGDPVEEASLQRNLGEFPAGNTDQGDRMATPFADAPQSQHPMTTFWSWWGGDQRRG